MKQSMKKRIFGIETEYGLLVKDNNDGDFRLDPMEIANKINNHIFSKNLGVLDLHYRATMSRLVMADSCEMAEGFT